MTPRRSMRHRLDLGAQPAMAWRPSGPRLVALIRSMLVSYLALGVTLYILPGRQSSGPLAVAGLVLAVAVTGALFRPVLAGLVTVLGSLGMLLLGAISQAIVLDVAIAFAPNLTIRGQPEVLVISWVAASVAAVVNWLLDAGSEDAFLDQLLGRAVHVAHQYRRAGGCFEGGLLIVQLDGVGERVLRDAAATGSLPTLSAWLRAGTHSLAGWHTGLPATTPAAQAVLLHGDVREVPAFRWFEKETGRLLVANHPRDAAEIERRISDGRGLLADGGVSVSNLFSGDAPLRLLTMSDARLPARDTHAFATFASARSGFARAVVLSVGTAVTELHQGRRQRRRDVQPRIRRGGVFAVQRAVTTVLLRDLSVAIVAEQIARGAPAIFVDFIDFDEVAHHAGPSRAESVGTLDGLDRLVGFFARVSHEIGHAYEIAVVSDHGQAEGATFAQLAGVTLAELVDSLASDSGTVLHDVGVGDRPAERWGSANLLLTGAARSDRAAVRAVNRGRATTSPGGGQIVVGEPGRRGLSAPSARAGVIVATGGSLAHIYLAEVPGWVGRERIDRDHPRLIDGLANHPQVGALMVRSAAIGGAIALGPQGWRLVTAAGSIGGEGVDPVAVFGAQACQDLFALDGRRHVGDIVVLARFDPVTGAVAAFEDLVGSHGGLGGGQNEAFLMHPSEWLLPSAELHGIDVHNVLRAHVPGRVETALR